MGDVVDEAGGPRNDADGVLVVRAWAPGAAGEMLARITMSGEDSAPVVRVVTSRQALHGALDEWLDARGL